MNIMFTLTSAVNHRTARCCPDTAGRRARGAGSKPKSGPGADVSHVGVGRFYRDGGDGAGLLLVPAWDFVPDGWLHGRMAILRGVESGFAVARAAKQGILTVSDNRGRIVADRTTGSGPFESLVASVAIENDRTFYDRTGDLFAWLDLALASVLLLLPLRARIRRKAPD